MSGPLDDWAIEALGLSAMPPADTEALRRAVLEALAETAERARSSSPYHGRILPENVSRVLTEGPGLVGLPLLTADELVRHGQDMVCLPLDGVARVVSMGTSGSTGRPKRLFFSDRDLERTMEFFRHGMRPMAGPGDRVLILLPGRNPDGVADLLARALTGLGAVPVLPETLDLPRAVQALDRGARTVVGAPVPVLQLAESRPKAGVQDVLLCWDRVPSSLVRRLEAAWDCRVLTHYGTVETGLGGAVECAPESGLHLRLPDLVVEVLDPDSDQPLPEGEWGELVVSTPRREAMPLFRYRTGDLGRILPGACACGSFLPRLDRVRGRLSDVWPKAPFPGLNRLDEVLFDLPSVWDFQAEQTNGEGALLLRLTVKPSPGAEPGLNELVLKTVQRLDPENGLEIVVAVEDFSSLSWKGAKRTFNNG
ncbi:MAG: phenylacetate--CoA ligase family protein [Deltaproteobacteria bacterium]|nr:phenylacetate--CoA ligase family protein [Deltaproteobacteria bacterium]